jgi:hypothetical protein
MLYNTYPIPGYGKYELKEYDDGSYEVISYYKEAKGKPLTPGRGKSGETYFKLYENGTGTILTGVQIRAKVERVKLKRIREEMNYTARNSIPGVIATGDYIVGSINKQTGAFSTSNLPAKHLTQTSAKQEAARLAGIDKSKKYVVLNVAAIASVEEVVWQ